MPSQQRGEGGLVLLPREALKQLMIGQRFAALAATRAWMFRRARRMRRWVMLGLSSRLHGLSDHLLPASARAAGQFFEKVKEAVVCRSAPLGPRRSTHDQLYPRNGTTTRRVQQNEAVTAKPASQEPQARQPFRDDRRARVSEMPRRTIGRAMVGWSGWSGQQTTIQTIRPIADPRHAAIQDQQRAALLPGWLRLRPGAQRQDAGAELRRAGRYPADAGAAVRRQKLSRHRRRAERAGGVRTTRSRSTS